MSWSPRLKRSRMLERKREREQLSTLAGPDAILSTSIPNVLRWCLPRSVASSCEHERRNARLGAGRRQT